MAMRDVRVLLRYTARHGRLRSANARSKGRKRAASASAAPADAARRTARQLARTSRIGVVLVRRWRESRARRRERGGRGFATPAGPPALVLLPNDGQRPAAASASVCTATSRRRYARLLLREHGLPGPWSANVPVDRVGQVTQLLFGERPTEYRTASSCFRP